MKNLSLLFIGLLMIPMFLLSSCDRGEDLVVTDTTDKSAQLRDYMIANNFDLNQIIGGTGLVSPSFVVSPTAANTNLSTYLILDIRQATGPEGFATGRISGAINIPFTSILTEADKVAVDKPILVVCYTGNQATYATALLRMYGYRNAVALKWGMAGWNKTTFGARWFNAIGNIANGHANFNMPPAAAPVAPNTFTAPAIITPATVGQEILKSRIREVVSQGYKSVTASEVLTNPSNYYINNYKSLTDYTNYGNIKGAFRIQPITLAANDHLKLNPSSTAKVVIYCYTGQTSGVVTAFLRVLNYDAYSLVLGMNALWNTNPAWGTSANRWDVTNGSPEAQTFTVTN